jgi:hypothetical protein
MNQGNLFDVQLYQPDTRSNASDIAAEISAWIPDDNAGPSHPNQRDMIEELNKVDQEVATAMYDGCIDKFRARYRAEAGYFPLPVHGPESPRMRKVKRWFSKMKFW